MDCWPWGPAWRPLPPAHPCCWGRAFRSLATCSGQVRCHHLLNAQSLSVPPAPEKSGRGHPVEISPNVSVPGNLSTHGYTWRRELCSRVAVSRDPRRHAEVSIPRTCERDLLWPWGLCGSDRGRRGRSGVGRTPHPCDSCSLVRRDGARWLVTVEAETNGSERRPGAARAATSWD